MLMISTCVSLLTLMRIRPISKICFAAICFLVILVCFGKVVVMFMKMFLVLRRILQKLLRLLVKLHCLNCRLLRLTKICPKLMKTPAPPAHNSQEILQKEE